MSSDAAVTGPTGRLREAVTPGRLVTGLVYVLSVVVVAWHLYYAYDVPMGRTRHSIYHFGLLLSAFFLLELDLEPESLRDHVENAVSAGFLVVVVATSTYIVVNYDRWLYEGRSQFLYTSTDVFVGALVILAVVYATWRAYGHLLAGVIVAAIGFGLAGPLLPGIFEHSGMSIERIVYLNTIELNGVFGFILGVGATWVVIFILFAGIIEAYGGMDYVIKMGETFGRRVRSGTVQVAVVASMLMGSINGSSAANVASTGSFTIPLMREEGIPPKYAAAIESIASTAGQILPPVMGAAAFLIADILGISFFEVIRAAVLPALLFYVTVAFTVHVVAIRHGWTNETLRAEVRAPRSNRERLRILGENVLTTLPYSVPLFVLVYALVILRFDPMAAGMWAIFSLPPSALARDVVTTGPNLRTARILARRTLEGCKIGTENMAPLTAVLAALGIVIQILGRTGFSQRLSFQIIALAGGVFVLVLLLTMFSSLLFGLGMPTTAAYVVVAILTAPVLVRLGIGELASHMFVFYFALLSTITPPIALTCAVASGIAGASFWGTCKQTVRMGLFAFVIPFIFVMNQELIYWDGLHTLGTFVAMSGGLLLLSVALVGYNLRSTVSMPWRVAYFAAAFAIFFVPLVAVQWGLAAVGIAWLVLLASPAPIPTIATGETS